MELGRTPIGAELAAELKVAESDMPRLRDAEAHGHRRGQPYPQTNDVDVDDRGLIYIVDRQMGFDVLEYLG